MAGPRRLGPGHGIDDILGPRLHHIVDAECASRPREAGDFPVEPGPIRDVHGDMQAERRIEGRVLEGHGQRAGVLKAHQTGETETRRQGPRHRDEFGRQIDTVYPAADGRGEIARRTAQAAADIENMIRRAQRHS